MKARFLLTCGTCLLLTALLLPNAFAQTSSFYIKQDAEALSVYKAGSDTLVLTQHAKAGMRPYLHPIMAPDGNGSLTEYSPGHHKHQTGLYWGFTRVNGTGAPADTLRKWFYRPNKPEAIRNQIGRDYFHNNGESHWRKVSASTLQEAGSEVSWQTVYQMLDASGKPILEETMNWSLSMHGDNVLIGLAWQGKALEDITINAFEYGGMFLRMPWRRNIDGEAVNNHNQRNQEAEGQRANWVDVGMTIKGRADWGHIAIMDHPSNTNHPTAWRVDGQLGIGPCRALDGDWHIKKGETEVIRHQIVAYTGDLDANAMNAVWQAYSGQ